jgi:cell division transport system permease protein
MLGGRSDLPLDRDSLGRFLPWLIAFMVYLAALALAGGLVLNDVAERWDKGVKRILSVQIAPAPPAPKEGAGKEDAKRLDTVLGILRSTPQIIRATPVGRDEIAGLLEPWLGGLARESDLPLPLLIDAELKPEAKLDVAALSKRLSDLVPGTAIDDHGIWLERMVQLIFWVETLAVLVVVFICLATIGTVVFATRTGLDIHHEAIEVLHLIGAQDSYIARQFANKAAALGLKGGLLGLVLALPTLFGIGALAGRMGSGLFPEVSLSSLQWAVLASLPLWVALIARLAARRTVMRNLARML